jgi:hypothetical protein
LPLEVKKVIAVSTMPGVVEVRYPETGEVRKIILEFATSVDDAKKKFPISRAAPMWEWTTNRW